MIINWRMINSPDTTVRGVIQIISGIFSFPSDHMESGSCKDCYTFSAVIVANGALKLSALSFSNPSIYLSQFSTAMPTSNRITCETFSK